MQQNRWMRYFALKYGLEYWSSDASLEELINAPLEWLDVPIYPYEIHARDLVRRAIKL